MTDKKWLYNAMSEVYNTEDDIADIIFLDEDRVLCKYRGRKRRRTMQKTYYVGLYGTIEGEDSDLARFFGQIGTIVASTLDLFYKEMHKAMIDVLHSQHEVWASGPYQKTLKDVRENVLTADKTAEFDENVKSGKPFVMEIPADGRA